MPTQSSIPPASSVPLASPTATDSATVMGNDELVAHCNHLTASYRAAMQFAQGHDRDLARRLDWQIPVELDEALNEAARRGLKVDRL